MRRTMSIFLALVLVVGLAPCAYAQPAGLAQIGVNQTDETAAAKISAVNEESYSSCQVIVVMDEGAANGAGVADLLSSSEQSEEAGMEEISDGAYMATAESPEKARDLALELAGQPGVAYVQPNYVYDLPETFPADGLQTLAVPNDEEVSKQWYLDGIGLTKAWDVLHTDRTVSVAVLDSPVNTDHEDLLGALDMEHAWDAAVDAPYGTQAWTHDHGTRVASIVGAVADNGKGICGASYDANVIPINVFTNESKPKATTAGLVRALDYVADLSENSPELNLRVVNMSVGGYSELGAEGADALLEKTVDDVAYGHDIAVVCAAGNGNTSQFIWPADWDCCISVTATNEDLSTRASFSDYNEYKDIAAPGVNMYGADAKGDDSYSADSGTSFAAPVVSGVLALMFAADPGLTRQEATDLLYETASDIGDEGRDDEFGNGLVNAEAAVSRALAESDCASKRFSDVDQSAWYQNPVGYMDFAVSKRLLYGSDGLLRPLDNVTRSEAVNVLWRAFAPEDVEAFVASDRKLTAPFVDAVEGGWYVGGLNWSYSQGIAAGYDDGTFGLGDNVTVEQYCCFLARLMASPEELQSVDFSSLDAYGDAEDVSSYARNAVAWCLEKGYTKGVAEGGRLLIDPQGPLSRARMSGLLYNVYQTEGGFFAA